MFDDAAAKRFYAQIQKVDVFGFCEHRFAQAQEYRERDSSMFFAILYRESEKKILLLCGRFFACLLLKKLGELPIPSK